MKYTLIGSGNTYSPIETVLKNRGITEDLFNLDESVVEDYNNLDNIIDGVELLLKHIKNGSRIKMITDSDFDGKSSATTIYRYIKDEFGVEIEYQLHSGKQHGISPDITIEDGIKLVIVPDAGTSDFKQQKELFLRGIDVLILDHHECDEGYSKHATVINNQLSKNIKNKQLSGVGIVYKFLKAMDDYLYIDRANNYLDLVALGNIADVMDLHSNETRYLVKKGLENINNTFLQALIDDNEFDLDGKFNIEKVGWTLAPKVNGCIRSGTFKEKEDMFKAFISDDYDFCLKVAKQCKKVKARQDRAVKTGMTKIEDDIKISEKDRVLVLSSKGASKSFTGLIAGKLTDKYGLPIIMYSAEKEEYIQDKIVVPKDIVAHIISRHNDRVVKPFCKYMGHKCTVLSGSCRGNNSITETFRSDLLETGLFVYCNGHEGAFGWKCKKDNLQKIKKILNEKYKDKEVVSGKEYQVDFILEHEEIIDDFVNEIAQYEDEWGNGISVPLVVFRNIPIYIEYDNIKGLNIIFKVNGVKFIKKYATNVLKESLLYQKLKVDVVGKCCMNSYDGKGMVEVVELDIK